MTYLPAYFLTAYWAKINPKQVVGHPVALPTDYEGEIQQMIIQWVRNGVALAQPQGSLKAVRASGVMKHKIRVFLVQAVYLYIVNTVFVPGPSN